MSIHVNVPASVAHFSDAEQLAFIQGRIFEIVSTPELQAVCDCGDESPWVERADLVEVDRWLRAHFRGVHHLSVGTLGKFLWRGRVR